MPPIGVRAPADRRSEMSESGFGRDRSAVTTPCSFPMDSDLIRAVRFAAWILALGCLPGCGGGTVNSNSGSSSTASPTTAAVSGASPFSSSCGATVPTNTTETFTLGSGLQPQVAVIPGGSIVGVWEQDRWTGLGSRAVLSALSSNGGSTWTKPVVLPFSACGGGNGAGAAYDRTSDPWISFAGSGVMVASALAFSANGFVEDNFAAAGGKSAVLLSRSTDGGSTWSAPTVLFADTNPGPTLYFNDRDSITADPSQGNVYVVWDRLPSDLPNLTDSAPAYLARLSGGGATLSGVGIMYDPGAGNEAFNNQIVILPSGVLLDFFTLISNSGATTLQVISSSNQGVKWSTTPATVSTIVSVGTANPIPNSSAIRDSMWMAQVAVDPASGAVAAVWQQSFSAGGTFDGIALSISTDGGTTWSAPVQINGAATVAAFSPSVRYLPGSVLAVTYYDFRDFVAGSSVLSTDAWLTESPDGKTWHELRLQVPFDLNQAPQAWDSHIPFGGGTGLFLGDNQGLALVGSSALALYAATNSAGARVVATQAPSPLTLSSAHVYTVP